MKFFLLAQREIDTAIYFGNNFIVSLKKQKVTFKSINYVIDTIHIKMLKGTDKNIFFKVKMSLKSYKTENTINFIAKNVLIWNHINLLTVI